MTSPLFRDGDVTAALTTPSVLSLAARYDITDRFAVMGSWSETGWSSLREVRINFVNPDPDSVEPFDWKDTEFVSLGAEYKLNDAWTLRGGAAFDETPTSIESPTPRLPDDDRTWYSIGATWQLSEAMEVSFAFTHIKPDDPRVDIADNQGHRLTGPFDGDANLYGISGQYRF